MTIKKREAELFRRWREEKGYEAFIADGVFDEEVWEAQTPKITFVLKDANWPDGDESLSWNLVRKPHPRNWTTWNNVARWTEALLEGKGYPGYVSPETRIKWLRKVSFLNLKKSGGGPQNAKKDLLEAAERDADFIREQLALYQPDIIVCGGWNVTADILEHKVLRREGSRLVPQDEEWIGNVRCFYIRFPGKERLTPVVSFYHPAYGRSHARWRTWYDQMREVGQLLLPSGEKEGGSVF